MTASVRENWVAVLGADWLQAYQGTPPYGQIGKVLKPFIDTRPFSEVQLSWRHYLKVTLPRFASPSKFAQTFGSWIAPTQEIVHLPYQPQTKWVAIPEGKRQRLAQVPISDPRPAVT